jgi:hypothetical protein
LDPNVIFNLDIDHSPEAIRAKLEPCFGLCGEFSREEMGVVRVVPLD